MSRSSCYCGDMMVGSICMNKNCDADCKRLLDQEKADRDRQDNLRAIGAPFPFADSRYGTPEQRAINDLHIRQLKLENKTNG